MNRTKSLAERLDLYTSQIPFSGCHIWTGHTDKDGYAIACMTLEDGKKNRRVHRMVYSEFVGEIPDGMMVCHKCDIPGCVNPDHLFLGTALENSRDKQRKGRAIPGPRDNRGQRNPNSRLDAASVEFIRKSHRPGSRKGAGSTGALAAMFGVNRTQIQKIAKGVQWK
jgi:hypothetical protein